MAAVQKFGGKHHHRKRRLFAKPDEPFVDFVEIEPAVVRPNTSQSARTTNRSWQSAFRATVYRPGRPATSLLSSSKRLSGNLRASFQARAGTLQPSTNQQGRQLLSGKCRLCCEMRQHQNRKWGSRVRLPEFTIPRKWQANIQPGCSRVRVGTRAGHGNGLFGRIGHCWMRT